MQIFLCTTYRNKSVFTYVITLHLVIQIDKKKFFSFTILPFIIIFYYPIIRINVYII